MHNVNLAALEETIDVAATNPRAVQQPVFLDGEWQVEGGRPQFVGSIPYPHGEVKFTCDFPPALGGNGTAPNPLAYCFWGGLACYAMTYAIEAARSRVELTALRATVTTIVDQTRALGLSDNPPVERLTWQLDVEADAPAELLERIKRQADERCPGVYCLRNPVPLETRLRLLAAR